MVAGVTAESDRLEELQRQIEELTEAVAARDTFIAVAAHELRNPMTPIIGQVDLLLARVRAGRCPPKQVEQRLERIQRTVRHYLKRAAVLLDVSRITSGRLELEPEPLDLTALLTRSRPTSPMRPNVPASPSPSPPRSAFPAPGTAWQWSRSSTTCSPTPSSMATETPVETPSADGRLRGPAKRPRPWSGGPAPGSERIFGRFERAVGPGERAKRLRGRPVAGAAVGEVAWSGEVTVDERIPAAAPCLRSRCRSTRRERQLSEAEPRRDRTGSDRYRRFRHHPGRRLPQGRPLHRPGAARHGQDDACEPDLLQPRRSRGTRAVCDAARRIPRPDDPAPERDVVLRYVQDPRPAHIHQRLQGLCARTATLACGTCCAGRSRRGRPPS